MEGEPNEPRMMLVRSDALEAARNALASACHPAMPWGQIEQIIVMLGAARPLGEPRIADREEAAE